RSKSSLRPAPRSMTSARSPPAGVEEERSRGLHASTASEPSSRRLDSRHCQPSYGTLMRCTGWPVSASRPSAQSSAALSWPEPERRPPNEQISLKSSISAASAAAPSNHCFSCMSLCCSIQFDTGAADQLFPALEVFLKEAGHRLGGRVGGYVHAQTTQSLMQLRVLHHLHDGFAQPN